RYTSRARCASERCVPARIRSRAAVVSARVLPPDAHPVSRRTAAQAAIPHLVALSIDLPRTGNGPSGTIYARSKRARARKHALWPNREKKPRVSGGAFSHRFYDMGPEPVSDGTDRHPVAGVADVPELR